MFTNGPGERVSIPGQVIPKIKKKWYLMPLCLTLSFIRYGSRVSREIQGKEWRLTLHLGLIAIEKRAFGLPSTTVSQLFLSLSLSLYIYIYRHI